MTAAQESEAWRAMVRATDANPAARKMMLEIAHQVVAGPTADNPKPFGKRPSGPVAGGRRKGRPDCRSAMTKSPLGRRASDRSVREESCIRVVKNPRVSGEHAGAEPKTPRVKAMNGV